MRRRELLLASAVLLVVPPARAQSKHPSRPHRIGTAYKLWPEARARFADRFREHGWEEGRDYVLVDSDVAGWEPLEEVVRSLLAKKPDLIYVTSTAHAVEAHRQTTTLPIVMVASGYPVEAGVAESLARPGKNVTGNSAYAGMGVWGKLLELLRDAKPGIKRIGVLWDYLPPHFPKAEIAPLETELAQAESQLRVALHRVNIMRTDHFQNALAALEAGKPDALMLTSGPVLWLRRQQVLQFALERRLPTIADISQPPEDKGSRPLLVFSPPWQDLGRSAIGYVVRILRDGAKPGELPIQQPAKFELTVNVAMAKALGLALPQSLLLRADRVTE